MAGRLLGADEPAPGPGSAAKPGRGAAGSSSASGGPEPVGTTEQAEEREKPQKGRHQFRSLLS